MAAFTFDSVDEIRAFVKDHLKGTRRGKGDDGDEGVAGTSNQAPAPAPIMPPPGNYPASGFAPQGAAGFPGAGAAPSFGGASPEVMALVNRINVKVDSAIANGQPVDAVLSWFRQRCGAEAAAATLDQIKTVFLPKLPVSVLEETAKLVSA